MNRSVLIEISPKKGRTAQARQVQSSLREAGLGDCVCRKVAAVYRLQGDLDAEGTRRVARELLSDPVAETYAVDSRPAGAQSFFVDVWCKPGVTDPAGESVLKAIRDLGVAGVERAAFGTRYEFAAKGGAGNAARKAADWAAKELLNPLIQECKIHTTRS